MDYQLMSVPVPAGAGSSGGSSGAARGGGGGGAVGGGPALGLAHWRPLLSERPGVAVLDMDMFAGRLVGTCDGDSRRRAWLHG